MAKGVEERAIFFYPGALVRELVTDYREVEPLFVVHQPWTHVLEPAIRRVLVHVPYFLFLFFWKPRPGQLVPGPS